MSDSMLRLVEEMMRIGRDLSAAADALEHLFHEHAQDLVLHVAHISAIVDEREP
jgi:hypothetical protein